MPLALENAFFLRLNLASGDKWLQLAQLDKEGGWGIGVGDWALWKISVFIFGFSFFLKCFYSFLGGERGVMGNGPMGLGERVEVEFFIGKNRPIRSRERLEVAKLRGGYRIDQWEEREGLRSSFWESFIRG